MRAKRIILAGLLMLAVTKQYGQDNIVETTPVSTPGTDNVIVGVGAGASVNTNSENVFLGKDAGGNTAYSANATDGTSNVFVGYQAGLSNIIGHENVYLGNQAGLNNTSKNNVFIGSEAGLNNVTGDGSIFIGHNAGYNETSPNKLYISNTSTSTPLIYGDFNGSNLTFNVNSSGAFVSINSTTGKSGLKFLDMPSGSSSVTNNAGKVLTVNNAGEVMLISDMGLTSLTAGTNISLTPSGSPVTSYTIDATNIYTNDGSLSADRTVSMNAKNLIFSNGSNTSGGKVYIGSDMTGTPMPSTYHLYVEGGILTEKVKVATRSTADWADYVFNDDYKLQSLKYIEQFIKANKHLPNIPSAADIVKTGLDLADMQAKQMEKIEELTLYAIEQDKKVDALQEEIKALKAQVQVLLNK